MMNFTLIRMGQLASNRGSLYSASTGHTSQSAVDVHLQLPTLVLWAEDHSEVTLADAEALLQEVLHRLCHVTDVDLVPIITINYPDRDERSRAHRFTPANSSRPEDLIIRALRPMRMLPYDGDVLRTEYVAIIHLVPNVLFMAELQASYFQAEFYIYDAELKRSKRFTYEDVRKQCLILKIEAPGQSDEGQYLVCTHCAMRGPTCVGINMRSLLPELEHFYRKDTALLSMLARRRTERLMVSTGLPQSEGRMATAMSGIKSERFVWVKPGNLPSRAWRGHSAMQRGNYASMVHTTTDSFDDELIADQAEKFSEEIEHLATARALRNKVCGHTKAADVCIFAGECKRYDSCTSRVHATGEWDERGADAFLALGPEPMRLLLFVVQANELIFTTEGVRHLTLAHRQDARGDLSSFWLGGWERAVHRDDAVEQVHDIKTLIAFMDTIDPYLAKSLWDLWNKRNRTPPSDPRRWARVGWQILEFQELRYPKYSSRGGWGSDYINGLLAHTDLATGLPQFRCLMNQHACVCSLSFYQEVFRANSTWMPTLFQV